MSAQQKKTTIGEFNIKQGFSGRQRGVLNFNFSILICVIFTICVILFLQYYLNKFRAHLYSTTWDN